MPSLTIKQYTAYRANTTMTIGITTLAGRVILGSGSLEVASNNAAVSANVVRDIAPRQFTSGLLYTVLRLISTANGDLIGLGCNYSQEDLSGGAGSAYGFVLNCGSGDVVTPRLVKYSAGVTLSPTTLASATAGSLADTTETASIVLRYAYSAALGPGVWLRGYVNYNGTGTPALPAYGDEVTPDVSYIDTASPLSTSAGEGEIAAMTSGVGKIAIFEKVGRFPYVVGAV